MKNNKGFSLVELLVAMAIASIVTGSLGYFLVTSIGMYGNETADVVLQQELQTSLNLIMDYAAETQTLVVSHSGGKLEYLMIGSQDVAIPTKMNCQIFFKNNDTNKLYLVKGSIDDYYKYTSYYKDLNKDNKSLDDLMKTIKDNACNGADEDAMKMYLLADYVDTFDVVPEGDYVLGWPGSYKNPISLNITLKFSKKAGTKTVTKEVNDNVLIRNKLKSTLVIDGSPCQNPEYEKDYEDQKDYSP